MIKRIVFWISIMAIILAIVWLIVKPDFEPVITALFGIAGLIGSHKRKETKCLKTEPSSQIVVRKEVQSYDDLSKSLIKLRNSFFSLNRNHRPSFDNQEERKKYWDDIAKDFILSYTSFRDIVDETKPFCCDAVYKASQELIELAIDELIYRNFFGGQHARPSEDTRTIKDEFLKHVESINSAIGNRLSVLHAGN